jgi:teichuronic acid biosynthesis protein TuaE
MKIKFSTLFSLLMGSAVIGSGVGYSKLYLYHLILFFFLTSWVVYSFCNKQTTLYWPKNNYFNFLLFLFSWYALSILWSINALYALTYLYYLFVGISLVFLICAYINTRERYLRVFKTLAVISTVALILALLESFTPLRLPTSPYSDYAALFGREGIEFAEFESNIQALIKSAPTSFWGNPNNLAVAMVLLMPFFLMQNKNSIKYIGLLSVLLVILMTGSRGVFISFLFGLFAYFVLRGVRFWVPLLTFGIFFSAFIFNNIDVLKGSENKRISELASVGEVLFAYLFEDSTSEDSIGSRQQLIKNGLNALEKTGGLGVGGGSSIAVQEQAGGVAGRLLSMHNFWVEVLVEAGVVVFVLFIIWYVSIAINLLKIYIKTKESFYRYQSSAMFLVFFVFAIAAVSASSVIYFLPMWIMFGLSIALISIHKREITNSLQAQANKF